MKYKEVLTYTLMIAIQVMVIVYWASVKTNYHVDELYSMGYARNFVTSGEYYQYLTDCPEFQFDQWISVSDLKEYLAMTEGDRLVSAPFSVVLKSFVYERNFFGLLNLAESVCGMSGISAVPGIALNILLFVLTQILLIILMKKLNMDQTVIYLSVAMFGFSGYLISMAVYVRFYMLIVMLMLAVLNLSYRAWSSDKWREIVIAVTVMMIAVYFSLKNSELTIPFFGSFWGCFVIASLLKRKWKQFISGLTVSLGGLAYIALRTDYLGALLNPEGYKYLNNVWITSSTDIRENLSNMSVYWMMDFATWVKDLFATRYFASASLFPLFLGIATICMIITTKKSNHVNDESSNVRIRSVTMGAFIIWSFLLSISVILGKDRIICIAVLFMIMCIMLKELAGITFNLKSIRISDDTSFILVILTEALICILFEGLCSHRLWRYYCFGFVSVAVVLWYAVDRTLKRPVIGTSRRALVIIMTGFVIINSVIPFKTRNIENVFEDEKAFVSVVTGSNTPKDIVLISAIEDDVISRHELYDCVAMVPDGTRLMVTDIDKYNYGHTNYPDEFLLWTYDERDILRITNDLVRSGYKVSDIGSDHCSKAYLVQR